MPHGGGKGDQLIRRRGNRNHRKQQDHRASNATPQATRPAPAHRRRHTCSFRSARARIVSSTKLAALAGTAKLRSAMVSSFRNAKNETAMHRMARPSEARRARAANALPSRPPLKCTSPWSFISRDCSRSPRTVQPTTTNTSSQAMPFTRGLSECEPWCSAASFPPASCRRQSERYPTSASAKFARGRTRARPAPTARTRWR